MVNDSRCQEDIGEAVLYPGHFYPGAEVVCFRPRPLARTGTSAIVNTGLQAPSQQSTISGEDVVQGQAVGPRGRQPWTPNQIL